MTEFLTNFKLIISVIGGAIMAALGGCDKLLLILACFVLVDYISGVVLAFKQGKLNSMKGFIGLLKKAMIFLVIIIAHLLDELTGIGAIRSMAVFFYISNEGISILENLGKLEVKIPQKIKDVLEQLEDNHDEHSKDTKSDN